MRKYNAKLKKQRTLHVISQSGYKYEPVPTIILKGKWLEKFGFTPGILVRIKCSNDEIKITL